MLVNNFIFYMVALVSMASVSAIPAYILRYKLLKRPMSKGEALLFCFLGFFVIAIEIVLLQTFSRSMTTTTMIYPGVLYLLWLAWHIVRKGDPTAERKKSKRRTAIDDSWEQAKTKREQKRHQ